MYDKIQKEFLTKEEIIKNKDNVVGYYSDFDYDLELDTKIDYENPLTIEESIVNSESEYREKMQHPITYDRDHIYGPRDENLLLLKR